MLPGQPHMLAAAAAMEVGGLAFMDPSLVVAGMRQQQQQGAGMPGQQSLDTTNKVSADRRNLEQTWKDPRFFPITFDTVMDYFCQRENPFFDPSSDNSILLMRGIRGPQLDEKLKQSTGIQYVLVQQSSPPLFLVRKQQRMSVDKYIPLCHYYILEGVIYQAPDLCTFLHSRLVGINDSLRSAFLEAVEMTRFAPSKGYSWEFKTKPSKQMDDKEDENQDEEIDHFHRTHRGEVAEEDPLSVRATTYQRMRTDMLLQELVAQFKPENLRIEMPKTEDGDGQKSQQNRATNSALDNKAFDAAPSSSQQLCNNITNGQRSPPPPTMAVNFQGLFFEQSLLNQQNPSNGMMRREQQQQFLNQQKSDD